MNVHRLVFAGLLVGLGARFGAAAADTGPDLMAGKVKTDRTVELEVIVDATPAQVFALWSTAEGVRKFFAPAATIDLRSGGAYEIRFAPEADPLGYSHGTTGARVLRFVPGREISFEWITFAGDNLLGHSAPPIAPRSLRDMRPLPTWVELSFEAVPGSPHKTRVVFHHYGFRHGEPWDASFAWFSRAWAGVLDGLAATCRGAKPGP
jgi:uncharacterized protein YndB with AHSA1/START domain